MKKFRIPKEIKWDEMQDCLDTAQAFITSFVMGDDGSQEKIAENFIQKYIDNGDADIFIYALSTICALNVMGVCNHFDIDPVEMLQTGNEMRVEHEMNKREDPNA